MRCFLCRPFADERCCDRRYRKYAFHLVLAGYRYNLAQQRRHTVRCYSTAIHLYQNNGWSHIEDHLNFALGRQHKSLQHYGESMQYLIDLLSECQQPADRQEAFLKEFMQVMEYGHRENSLDSASLDIPIPAVRDNTIQVRANETPEPFVVASDDVTDPLDPLAADAAAQQPVASPPVSVAIEPTDSATHSAVDDLVWADMEQGLENLYSIVRQSAGQKKVKDPPSAMSRAIRFHSLGFSRLMADRWSVRRPGRAAARPSAATSASRW